MFFFYAVSDGNAQETDSLSASIHVLEQFFRQFKDMRFIGQNPVGCFGAGYGLEVMESDFQRQGGSGEVILFKPGYHPIDDAFERFFEFLQISFGLG